MSETVSAADIVDENTLKAWLEGRPRADALRVAHRAALRVLPLWGATMDAKWARDRELTALPILRCGVISVVASTMSTADIREKATAAYAAANAAANAAATARDANAAAAARDANAAAAARDANANAAAAAYAAANAADAAAYAANAYAANAANAAARAATARTAAWAAVRADAEALEAGAVPGKLWPGQLPDYFTKAETKMQRIWDAEPATRWGFWRRWWAAAVAGQPLDPALQLAIVRGVDNETWKDPDKTAARIAEIEAEFEAEQDEDGITPELLEQAADATPNAEYVEPNPETGRFRLVSASEITDDLFGYTSRKVTAAIEMIRTDTTQQYTALFPDLQMLESAMQAEPRLPVELFDACASAVRRAVQRADPRNGSVPELKRDPVLSDYVHRLREVGADILGNDPATQSVLDARHAVLGTDVFLDNREEVLDAVDEIEPIVEGQLAEVLPRDAETATNPEAGSEDRKSATYRLVSRVVRIAAYGVAGTGAAIVGTKEVLEAIPAIQASPQFQQLLEFALRWLGMVP